MRELINEGLVQEGSEFVENDLTFDTLEEFLKTFRGSIIVSGEPDDELHYIDLIKQPDESLILWTH